MQCFNSISESPSEIYMNRIFFMKKKKFKIIVKKFLFMGISEDDSEIDNILSTIILNRTLGCLCCGGSY